MQSSSSGQAGETGRPTTLLTHSKSLQSAQECFGGSRACVHFHLLIDMTKTTSAKKTTTPKVTFLQFPCRFSLQAENMIRKYRLPRLTHSVGFEKLTYNCCSNNRLAKNALYTPAGGRAPTCSRFPQRIVCSLDLPR